MSQDPITKMNAVSLICLETGRGRRYVEAKMKEMVDAGLIRMDKTPYSTAILISRADIDKVIAAIRQES